LKIWLRSPRGEPDERWLFGLLMAPGFPAAYGQWGQSLSLDCYLLGRATSMCSVQFTDVLRARGSSIRRLSRRGKPVEQPALELKSESHRFRHNYASRLLRQNAKETIRL
jgi:hypothetical protein